MPFIPENKKRRVDDHQWRLPENFLFWCTDEHKYALPAEKRICRAGLSAGKVRQFAGDSGQKKFFTRAG